MSYARPQHRETQGEAGRRSWPLIVAAAAIALFVCYLRLSSTVATSADGASAALRAWAMLHGNILLRGWTLTDVSFYTTELPEYIAIEAVRGLNEDTVHVAAALTYTLLVVLAALTVLLSVVIVGDRIAVLDAAVPLALVGGIRAHRAMPRHREPVATHWFELSLVAAGAGSVAVADALTRLTTALGGYSSLPLVNQFTSSAAMPAHMWMTLEGILNLYGADFFEMHFTAAALIALIHLTGVGPPAHVYHYKTFTIMTWNTNLLTRLGTPPSNSPGNLPTAPHPAYQN